MKLEKFVVKRFRKLTDFKGSFTDGINLVKGPNEAGKSTLVDAITCAFFEDPKSTKKGLKSKTSWGMEKGFEVQVDFTANGTAYTIKKDFESGEIKLTNKSTNEKWDDRKKVEEIIFWEMGFPSKEIFLSTACIQQDEMSRFASNADAIKDRLEGLVTGGTELIRASEILNKLNLRINQLKKEGTKNLGEVQACEKARDELMEELDRLKRNNNVIFENRASLMEASSNLEKINKEYQFKKMRLEKAKEAAQLYEKVKAIEDKYNELTERVRKVQESEKNVRRLREESSRVPSIDRSDMANLEELEVKVRYLEGKRTDAEMEQQDIKKDLATNKRKAKFAWLMPILFLFTAAGVVVGRLYNEIGYWVAIFPFGILLAFSMVMSFIYANRKVVLKRKLNLMKLKLEEIETDVYHANLALNSMMEKYKVSNMYALREHFDNLRDIERQIKNEMAKYEGLLGDKNLKELEEELNVLTLEFTGYQERFEKVRLYNMSVEELDRLSQETTELEEEKKKLEISSGTLRKQLEGTEGGIELEASLEGRLDEVNNLISCLKKQLEIYQIVVANIQAARSKVLDSAILILEEQASKFLKQITAGKYEKVRFDKESLNFEVYSAEFGGWLDPHEDLSRGTIDQIYLTCRLALLGLVTGDKKPMAIMDDPFVSFDAERRKGTLELLKSLSKEYQVLLLTCHDFYDQYQDNIIQLT
jgi:DNA repair exonuclease SbcCD ATPase subunit